MSCSDIYFIFRLLQRFKNKCWRVTGCAVLHTTMAVETLGRWQDTRAHDGPGRRYLFGGREETKEEALTRLSLGKPAVPQLVVLPVLPL